MRGGCWRECTLKVEEIPVCSLLHSVLFLQTRLLHALHCTSHHLVPPCNKRMDKRFAHGQSLLRIECERFVKQVNK